MYILILIIIFSSKDKCIDNYFEWQTNAYPDTDNYSE